MRRFGIGAKSRRGADVLTWGSVALACCVSATVAQAMPRRGTVAGGGGGVGMIGAGLGTEGTGGGGRTGVIAAANSTDGTMAMVHDPAPDPGLGPDEVVGIVLRALQHNNDPVVDHGIAITFAFTSPENHDITGPLDKFRALVKSPAYRVLVGHMRADRGPVTVVAEHAREQVAITGAHGERARYVFLLSRQEIGAHKGCWMTDGVLREADPVLDTHERPLVTAVALRRD